MFGFDTKHACDRQTDRQIELRLPRPLCRAVKTQPAKIKNM